MPPFFTVIVPTYNRVELAPHAIESVLRQDFKGGVEILVGDDGSTDGTPDELEARFGSSIRVFRQANLGPGPARNLAAAAATGRYLFFLDSDDALLPWSLRVTRAAIEGTGDPALVIGSVYDTRGSMAEDQVEELEPAFRRFDSLYHSRMAVPVVATDRLAVRRDAFERVGGFTGEVFNAEDVDFIARAGLEEGFTVIDRPHTVLRRYHEGQISRDPRGSYKGRMFLLDSEQLGLYPGGATYRRHRQEMLSFWARIASLEMNEAGRRDLGRAFYTRTFMWHLRAGRWRYLLGYPWLWLRAGVPEPPDPAGPG